MQCNVSFTVEILAEAELAELEQVVLGDGAEWIKTQAELHFPEAVTILDWAHPALGCCRLFELYLALNAIEQRGTKVRPRQTNSFVERFHRTVKEEFFKPALRETFYESVEALQADLDRWLVHYNTERPHLGYRT
jgi:Integrase core domain